MSDNYQAIYDAVRSRLSNGNIGDAVRDAVSVQMSGAGHHLDIIRQDFCIAANEMQRPCVLFRPTLSADGTAWCALYGGNLQEGIAGFGETPAEAMAAFDRAWLTEKTPRAQIKELTPR